MSTTKAYSAADDRSLHLKYLVDINAKHERTNKNSSVRLLSEAEEQNAANLIQASIEITSTDPFTYKVLDEKILRANVATLVRHNLLFVISVAKKYQGRGLSLNDLIQQGNLGAMEAALRFNPKKGMKFITYAVWWIKQEIKSFIHEHGRTVKLPLNVITEIRKINKAKEWLNARYGCIDPFAIQWGQGTRIRDENGNIIEITSLQQLPEKYQTDIMQSRILALESISHRNVLLDDPLGNEDGDQKTRMDRYVPDDNHYEDNSKHNDAHHKVHLALKILSPRNREVMIGIWGIGLPFPLSKDELAKKFNVTTTSINNIIRVSKEAMHKYLTKLDKFETRELAPE